MWDGTFALQFIKLICKKKFVLISSHTINEKKKYFASYLSKNVGKLFIPKIVLIKYLSIDQTLLRTLSMLVRLPRKGQDI